MESCENGLSYPSSYKESFCGLTTETFSLTGIQDLQWVEVPKSEQ